MRRHAWYCDIVLFAAIPCAAWAQTSGTLTAQLNVPGGSATGIVVVASLSVPDTAAGLTGTRVFAGVSDVRGQVSFSNLPFGIYSVCAEPHNGILIEPCDWTTPSTLHLTAQSPSGSLNLTVPKGIPVDIRVDDPAGLATSVAGGQTLDVGVLTPRGTVHLHPAASDSGGLNYHIMAPPSVAASIQIFSGPLRVVDSTGSAVNLSSSGPLGAAPSFNLNSTTTGQFFRYTIQRNQ